MNQALIDSIRKDLDALHVNDDVKSVYVPFETLGADIVSRLPSIQGEILVVSDAGLFVAVLQRLRRERLPFNKVRFLCHTEALQNFGAQLGVPTTLVCYNELSDWLKADMGLKFDIIVGNPPYQEASELREGESTRSAVRLWEHFLQLAVDHLADDGDLLFVTPANWIGSTSSSFKLMKANTVVFADVSESVKDAFNGVGGSMRFSWYWLKKGTGQILPTIRFNDAELQVDLFNMEFQPVKSNSGLDYSICQKLHAFDNERLKWKRQDHEHVPLAKYEVSVHRAKGSNSPVDVLTDGSGIGYTFSTDNKKIAEAVAHNMQLKLYKHLRWILRPGMALVSTFTLLPVPTTKMSDQDLYDHFGLSEVECQHIERVIK